MTDDLDGVKAAVAGLDETDEDDLYRLLALRIKTVERDPSMAGQYAPATVAPTELGIAVPDLLAFGRRAFLALATAGQSVICGSDSDAGFHLQRLLSMVNKDATTVTATIAALLVAQLAIAPAVAGIVAAIVVGKVAPISLDALCATWSAKLAPATTTATPSNAPA